VAAVLAIMLSGLAYSLMGYSLVNEELGLILLAGLAPACICGSVLLLLTGRHLRAIGSAAMVLVPLTFGFQQPETLHPAQSISVAVGQFSQVLYGNSVLVIVLGLASASAAALAATISRLRPAEEFLRIPETRLWTERVYGKAKGWITAVFHERSGDAGQALHNYVISAAQVAADSPQWAALSLFSAALCAHSLGDDKMARRMLRCAATFYERAFDSLIATFPEAAVWTARESARCYMLAGYQADAERMMETAKQIAGRIAPLQPISLDERRLPALPSLMSERVFAEADRKILQDVERELEYLESVGCG